MFRLTRVPSSSFHLNRMVPPTRSRRRFRPNAERLEDRTVPSTYEVWTLSQSNTFDEDGLGLQAGGPIDSGGNLYIYQGHDLAGTRAGAAVPEVIDLGGAARTLSRALTGTSPQRAHYLSFNQAHSHALISFVTSGHVLFMDAATRGLVDVIDVGLQAHAAVSAPDDSFVLVANQNGKLVQRIDTDFDNDGIPYEDAADIALDNAATLNLAVGVTPNGHPRETPGVPIRPNNTPVFTVFGASGRLAFVTLGGGGMFVINPTTTPMSIVGEYDRTVIEPAGLLGVETAGKVYVNSGVGAFVAGGVATRDPQSGVDLYSFSVADFNPNQANPPNTPSPRVVIDLDGQGDAHGLVLTKDERYLWMANRQANQMYVIDTSTDQVVNVFDLAGGVSNDPAPDIMGISPSGNRVFVSLRGPNPLTGNIPSENNAVGSTPGVGVIRVQADGRSGVLHAVARISHLIDGVERADPHALAVRNVATSTPPKVESVVINDGSAQRSRVTSLTVTFSREVTLDDKAFELVASGKSQPKASLTVATSFVGVKTVATLTFSGRSVIGGSLPDGNYRLIVHGHRIHDTLGEAVDGDGDGDAGGDRSDAFFRLFGDGDGDRDVDWRDLASFLGTLGNEEGDADFLAHFDYDGDGDVDWRDLLAFALRFGRDT